MTEHHKDVVEFFIAAESAAGSRSAAADGSLARPFTSLPQALTAMAASSLQSGGTERGLHGRCDVEIVRVERAGEVARPTGRPAFRFFIDATAASDGDGSELAPWPNLTTALGELSRRVVTRQLELEVGQRLRLTHREVFTATDRERRRQLWELLAKCLFGAMAFALVIPVVLILSYLVIKAWPALSWEFLSTNPKNNMTAGGIWAPLIGTFFLVLTSLLIAAPIGVLAGVYLNEYARDNWLTRVINLAVVNLAGVPSIVHALFGVGAFVLFAGLGRSLFAAACTVAVMTLPVIITSSREALAAVPRSFREACWNMGATRWQTIRTIVLPNSISGILTGVILQVARAAGETAPILLTGAVFFVPVADKGVAAWIPYGLDDRFMALSMHLFTLATQVKGASQELQFATAVVLIGLVLVVNSLSIAFRVYLRARKKW